MLNLGEVLVDGLVQNHFSQYLHGYQVFGPNLRSVEDVKVKVVLLGLGDDLDTEVVLRERSIGNGLLEVLAVEVL